MVVGVLISFLTLAFLFSSCGFVNKGGPGSFQVASQGGPGDGETPTLGPRLRDNPQLAEEKCEDNDRCKETCRDMYPDSYKECYGLTIQQVSDVENVFYALVNADSEELEDIDGDHLKNYLKIGLDSWQERVIEKLTSKDNRNARFSNILTWIVNEEKDVVPLLEKEDPKNEILEQIVLKYCNVADSGRCGNTDSANPHTGVNNFPTGSCALKITTSTEPSYRFPSTPSCTAGSPATHYVCPELSYFPEYSIAHSFTTFNESDVSIVTQDNRGFAYGNTQDGKDGVVFDYADDGGLYYCYHLAVKTSDPTKCSGGGFNTNFIGDDYPCITLTHKKLAEIEDDDDKDLFMSLVGVGKVFFNKAADDLKTSAFALGHKLLEKACSGGTDTSLTQCMSVFYCWLNDHIGDAEISTGTDSEKSFLRNSDLQEKIELRIADLEECDYSNFD